jgi:membrane associated rhomboid family serine protease
MRVTLILIIANLLVYGLQLAAEGFTEIFALTPAFALEGAWWQFITYMFLHGGSMHLLLNMFVLGIFGMGVENQLGRERFVILYFLAGLGSAFLHIFLTGDSMVMMLGASGAVFGILTAYGFLFPRNWIIMFPGIPMPAILAVAVFAGLELFLGVTGLQEGIANFGHLGGIITGVAFMLAWKFSARKIPPEEREPRNYEFIWE